MARRLESYQVNAVHREKLASLGTLAAGLMHELNNPGAAALRRLRSCEKTLPDQEMVSLYQQTPHPGAIGLHELPAAAGHAP